MSDIVEQLRYEGRDISSDRAAMREAADEIERLRAALQTCRNTAQINLKVAQDRGAEIERLRAALKEIVRFDEMHNSAGSAIWLAGDVARRALEQKAPESLLEKVEKASRRPVSDNPQSEQKAPNSAGGQRTLCPECRKPIEGHDCLAREIDGALVHQDCYQKMVSE